MDLNENFDFSKIPEIPIFDYEISQYTKWFISYEYSLSFVYVSFPLPSRYLTVTVLDTTWPNVTDRSSTLLTVHQRYSPFINVTDRYLNVTHRSSTLPTVHQRYPSFINVTHRSSTLPTVTSTLLNVTHRYLNVTKRYPPLLNVTHRYSTWPERDLNFTHRYPPLLNVTWTLPTVTTYPPLLRTHRYYRRTLTHR